MIPEVKALEPQLKQILYGCVEHVQATKAALYLSASYDLNDKIFDLVTSYQFHDSLRKLIRNNDDLVDRMQVKRAAFFVNGLGADQRFSEMLFRQGTDRMLAAPLFSRGRLLGFIDMRDKAGKKPFDPADLEAAKTITDAMLALLGASNLFGVGPIALSPDPSKTPVPNTVPLPNVMPVVQSPVMSSNAAPSVVQAGAPNVAMNDRGELSAQATRVVELAREMMSKRQLTPSSGRRVLTENDIDSLRLLLPGALAIPGAVWAALSLGGSTRNPLGAAAVASLAEDANETILAHLQAMLKRGNHPHVTVRPQTIYPSGIQPLPITVASLSAVVSLPVNIQTTEGLLLTVAFERTAEPQASRGVQIFLRQIEPAVEAALNPSGSRAERQLLAEKLLEPDFQKYPELATHCRAVSAIAHRFAMTLEIPATHVETVRIAALVHDVGMRLLDYERLYKRATLTAEELRSLAEHPIVGAALVEPLLGAEVANAVLRHHERVDGKGYPSRLSGQQIPVASRIIQLCDAWVAMTAANTYQIPLTREQAITKLREGAGTQFDEGLVARFLKVLPELGV